MKVIYQRTTIMFLKGHRPKVLEYVDYWELLSRCWHSNPKARPSVWEILDNLDANSATLESTRKKFLDKVAAKNRYQETDRVPDWKECEAWVQWPHNPVISINNPVHAACILCLFAGYSNGSSSALKRDIIFYRDFRWLG